VFIEATDGFFFCSPQDVDTVANNIKARLRAMEVSDYAE